MLILLGIVLLGFTGLAWKNSKHALGLILALLPTYLIRFQILGLPTTFLEILIVVFLFIILCKIKRQDLLYIQSLGFINWAVGLFILAGIISVFASPEILRALGQLKAFIIEPVFLFYASILTLRTEKDSAVAIKWLLGGAFIVSLFGILQYFTFLGLPPRFWGGGEEMARIISFFEHPNQLALYLSPLIVFFTALFINNYKLIKSRWIFALTIIVPTVALVLTFSRGAWMGVFAGLFIVFANRYSLKIVIIPLLLAILMAFLTPPIRDRISNLSDASTSAHLDLMKAGVNKIIESPLVGNGLYGFRQTLEQANFKGEVINYPHNIFLNFWVEMGLLGLISFALIFYFASNEYKKHPTILKFAAGMFLVTVIVHGLVDIPYLKNDLSVMFWFVVSLFYLRSSQ